ncbi:MAG: acyl carrier protein [Cyclobacteriaceae bacterium]|nr:acyl carrier protein [Cyclobacteriaceae bacterium HetDA_MAG_MS6]
MKHQDEVTSLVKTLIAKELKVAPDSIGEDVSFHDLGLDSVNSLFLLGDLEQKLNLDIDPLSLYDNPTVSSFSNFISTLISENI